MFFHQQEVLRHSLLMAHDGALRKLRQEVEDQLQRAQRDREELQNELRTLQHDRDQCLLQAETEKQQVGSGSTFEKLLSSNAEEGWVYHHSAYFKGILV